MTVYDSIKNHQWAHECGNPLPVILGAVRHGKMSLQIVIKLSVIIVVLNSVRPVV